jgi:uncharacterized protein YbaP (TraB family)
MKQGHFWTGAVGAAVLLAAGAAAAQPANAPPTLVEEVEVVARLPGPALWRISTPTSQLWILGAVSPMPKAYAFDDRRLQTVLDGARELVLPPAASFGVGDLFGLLIDPGHRLHMPPGETVRSGLDPALRARFEAAARLAGQDAGHYDHWRPVIASLALAGDAIRRNGLDPTGPMTTVNRMAHAKRIKVRRLANYKAGELITGIAAASPEAGPACLTLAAETVERLPMDSPRVAAAWSRGDIAGIKALQARAAIDRCLDAVPAVAALQDRVARDWAKDLARVLAQPGKTVVVVDLDSLIRSGGLLDQLHAQGLEVVGPSY